MARDVAGADGSCNAKGAGASGPEGEDYRRSARATAAKTCSAERRRTHQLR